MHERLRIHTIAHSLSLQLALHFRNTQHLMLVNTMMRTKDTGFGHPRCSKQFTWNSYTQRASHVCNRPRLNRAPIHPPIQSCRRFIAASLALDTKAGVMDVISKSAPDAAEPEAQVDKPAPMPLVPEAKSVPRSQPASLSMVANASAASCVGITVAPDVPVRA